MEVLARMVISTAELLEAEGRVLRRQVLRVAWAIAVVLLTAGFAVIGAAFLLYGLFGLLARWITPAGSSAVFGVIALALAAGGVLIVRKTFQDDPSCRKDLAINPQPSPN